MHLQYVFLFTNFPLDLWFLLFWISVRTFTLMLFILSRVVVNVSVLYSCCVIFCLV